MNRASAVSKVDGLVGKMMSITVPPKRIQAFGIKCGRNS